MHLTRDKIRFCLSTVSIRIAVDIFIALLEGGGKVGYHVTVTGNGQILRNTQEAMNIDFVQRIVQVQGSGDHLGVLCL
jgi:hypothetical protein